MNSMHLVFSTKHREPLILSCIEDNLHRYLGSVCNELKCLNFKVGGYLDHVHILCNLHQTMAVCDLVKNLKIQSSHWMKKQGPAFEYFYWQDGYGAFSVGRTEMPRMLHYVGNQKPHHQSVDYQDEFRAITKENGMTLDERYAWD